MTAAGDATTAAVDAPPVGGGPGTTATGGTAPAESSAEPSAAVASDHIERIALDGLLTL